MIVLVTGCRSGFGKLIAHGAARAGHTVYAGLRDLDTAAELLEGAPGGIVPLALDVTSDEQRQAAVTRILDEHGRIDALINNAGIAIGGFVEQFDEDEVRQVFDVNVFGAWALTKLCLPGMRARGDGLILNVTSVAGRLANPGLAIYAGSKFALEGITEGLRHEMRPFGVRVVLVEPGPYRTDIMSRNRRMVRAAEERSPYAAHQAKLLAMLEKMEARLGDPQEVADLCVRLLDDPAPRLRYALGPTTTARLALKRFAPFGLTEAVMKRLLGI
ncbi:MAG: SDR family oxidoreductase [Polyangiaceae bacterium]|nr:SDR family oxidoreductase [Planctomycetota bacterium]